ncbi:MAG: Gfo/Idh/MocA family oxidoreductase [Candidatus Eisenbacteria bacterium]
MVRIGLIGCGYWGPNLVRNLTELEEADLAVVADVDPSKVRRLTRRYPSLRGTEDAGDVLSDPKIEAVVIVTPAETHYDLARRALEAGKHVLVEKPLAMNPDESKLLAELADRTGLTLMVGHTFEYNPAVRHLKKLVRDEGFGKTRYVYSTRVNLGIFRPGINAMWNLAPHDLSILLYLLDEAPVSVIALGRAFLKPDVEDVVFLFLEFPSGVIAHVHVSWLDPSKVRRVTVVGEKRMAVYDDLDSEQKLKLYDRGFESTLFQDGGIHDYQVRLRAGDILAPKIETTEPLRIECAHFIECVREKKRPLTDGWNGHRVVAALAAADESLRAGGRRVEVRSS